MLENLNFQFISNKECNDSLQRKIADIKSFHWHYSTEEHLRWMKENIKEDDYHLMLFCKDVLIAYMNMVNREIEIEDKKHLFLGIGNVCVDGKFLNKKLGVLLMDICKFYLSLLNIPGILLCKDNLVPFYLKTGWMHYKGKVICDDAILKCNTFFSTPEFIDSKVIKIDSIF